MTKPAYRDYDEIPKRSEDVRLSLGPVKFEGSARSLATLIITIAVAAVALGGLVGIYMHERDSATRAGNLMLAQAAEHGKIIDAIKGQTAVIQDQTWSNDLQTCVMTLTTEERLRFRKDGDLCNGQRRLKEQGVLK